MDFNSYVSLLNSDIRIIKGIGEKKAQLMSKLGIHTVWDIVYSFPRAYEDRRKVYTIADAPRGSDCCIDAIVRGAVIEKKINAKMSLYILRIEDHTGTMNVKWFSSPFNKHKLKRGMRCIFYGTVDHEMTLKVMEPYGENNLTGKIIPIYSLTSGLTQRDFSKAVDFALNLIDGFYETLPEEITDKYNLMPLGECIINMHHPEDEDKFQKARYRLAFEELFILTLAMKKLRTAGDITTGITINDIKCVRDFANQLPYELTDDQKKCLNEICMDLKSSRPMNRLIQGDVGSGKTAVAAGSAYVACKNGYQTVFMAPTEILANQHYKSMCSFFEKTDIKVTLLTGDTKGKKELLCDIADGKYDVIIGTHALIEDRVKFANLGLCITDEQHRFGVHQRAKLAKGNDYPNVLVMSATPIPRTLSLVLYGDLDISIIKTMPKGRQKIDTFCINESKRARLESFIEKQAEINHQCFVVCPLIEDSDKIEAVSAQETYERLKSRFPNLNIAFLHGKMPSEEKDEIMNGFRNGDYSILVSTTVIEVGIDIPNATLMIVENAERFGLSQLHQLRGRVGRGSEKSYCILVSETKTDDAKERMKIMCAHSDGFEIASEDLRLRGCGEFFGTRQHGIPELKIANLFTDLEIAQTAREACDEIINSDPELKNSNHTALSLRITKLFDDFGNIKIFN